MFMGALQALNQNTEFSGLLLPVPLGFNFRTVANQPGQPSNTCVRGSRDRSLNWSQKCGHDPRTTEQVGSDYSPPS
jgi:hypothetical protein